MGTLKKKWGLNGDQKTHFGPHGDQSPQMGTNVGAVGSVHAQKASLERPTESQMKTYISYKSI